MPPFRCLVVLGVAIVLGGCSSPADVDPNEGTGTLTYGEHSAQHRPLICRDHTSIAGGFGTGLDHVDLSATLTSSRSAHIEVTVPVYKGGDATYRGTASVSLTSSAGPIGSLDGAVDRGGTPVPVSAEFFCTAAGGGVYTTDEGEGALSLYFTVSHDGRRVVDLVASTTRGEGIPRPNVGLRASDVAIAADGGFSVTAALVAEDASGLVAQGRPASLRGRLDRFGGASGRVTFPASVAPSPFTWTGRVAGPIAKP